MRLELVGDSIDVKICQIDVTPLPASDRITSHTWHPDGTLLVGSSGGNLFVTRKAAVPLSMSHEMDAASADVLRLSPAVTAELSRFTAGAIVSLHIAANTVAVLFECPDTQGGLLLWIPYDSLMNDSQQIDGTGSAVFADQIPLKAVQLPLGRIIFSATSPDRSQIAVLDDASKILILSGQTHAEIGSFTLASASHCGGVVGIDTVQGTPSADGNLFMTLDSKGFLRCFVLEHGVRMANENISIKLSLQQSGSVGAAGAALASHPIFPLVAVATAAGHIHLIGAAEFAGCGVENDGHHNNERTCAQFSACVMPKGAKKQLQWSPDGAMLACLDTVTGTLVLLKRKPSPLQKEKHIFVQLNRTVLPNANHICWHQHATCMPVLIVHIAQGQLLVLETPRENSGVDLAASASQFRLQHPLAAMLVLSPQSTESHATIVGACLDSRIRCYRVPLGRGRRPTKKGTSVVLPMASVEGEGQEVGCKIQTK